MFLTKDNLRLGLVLGIIGPLVGLAIVYFIKFPSLSFKEFLDYFMHDNKVITNVGTFALLANALLFAIYVHFDKTQTFKGIFIITLFYGIGILILKLFNN
jgi:cbb3-type cytochrome oxidase subunit 1